MNQTHISDDFRTFISRVQDLDSNQIIEQAEAVLAIEEEKMRGKRSPTRARSPGGAFVRSPGGAFQTAKPETLLAQNLQALLFFLKNKKLPKLPEGSNIPSPYSDKIAFKMIAESLVAKKEWHEGVLALFN